MNTKVSSSTFFDLVFFFLIMQLCAHGLLQELHIFTYIEVLNC